MLWTLPRLQGPLIFPLHCNEKQRLHSLKMWHMVDFSISAPQKRFWLLSSKWSGRDKTCNARGKNNMDTRLTFLTGPEKKPPRVVSRNIRGEKGRRGGVEKGRREGFPWSKSSRWARWARCHTLGNSRWGKVNKSNRKSPVGKGGLDL